MEKALVRILPTAPGTLDSGRKGEDIMLKLGLLALPLLGAAISCGTRADETLPAVSVYRTQTCGCCKKWVAHLEHQGFVVNTVVLPQIDLDTLKHNHGVPMSARSCHTALVGSYVVEGHVPASEIQTLLRRRLPIAGLAVPGMPIGSPGMEGPHPIAYDVLAIDKAGRLETFSTQRP
jgi:hypothetical protein